MKKTFAILILAIFLTAGCVSKDIHPAKLGPKEEISEEKECEVDSDCKIGGCNGEICAKAEFTEEIASICVFKPEFACYKLIDCKCINGRCAWDKTEEFLKCFSEKKSQ